MYGTAVAIAERTYSFRASDELASRMQHAARVLGGLVDGPDDADDLADRVASELALALARNAARFRNVERNQSAFLRESVELLVTATEKVADDIHLIEAYAAVRDDPTDGERAAARATRIAGHRRSRPG